MKVNKEKKNTTILFMIPLFIFFLLVLSVNTLASEKKLYFIEDKDRISWYSDDGTTNETVFMDFRNMIPGGTYEDSMLIENKTKKTYQLYMEVEDSQDNSKLLELLEMISMKVYYRDVLIYDGTALGTDNLKKQNIQNLIALGEYKPGDEGKIFVDLKLSEKVGIEFNDLLTTIDWRFIAEVKAETDPPEETAKETAKGDGNKKPGDKSSPSGKLQLPKTEDITQIGPILILCLVSILIILKTKKNTKNIKE